MKKKNSRESYLSIRQKLIAAVAMLLVATFMVASSSYAWFTLSTAPEVTGIKTSVGANGSLEIALVPVNGIPTEGLPAGVGNSGNNETWGNLVDLSNQKYGLQDVTLYPSVIALEDGKVVPSGPVLATPKYGADGRVKSISPNAVSGVYTNGQFVQSGAAMGVTAIGTASSMTQQQLDYMNAGSKLTTSLAEAKRAAENALSNNGQGLVQIILGYVGGATSYDIAAIGGMVETLNDVPGYLEDAMMYYIITCVANLKATDMNDDEFIVLKNAIIADCEDGFPNLSGDTATIAGQSFTVPTMLKEVYGLYSKIKTAIQTADTNYTAAYESASKTTDQTTGVEKVTISDTANATATETVKSILLPLMNVDKVTVNNHPKTDFTQEKIGEIAGEILTAGGVVVNMPKDSGVFADIAQVSGQISATFTYSGDVSFGSLSLTGIKNLPVNMKTSIDDGDFKTLSAALLGTPASRQDADAKLSTLYGYSLDFAFRTNAVSSNLMLQTKAANRIYSTGGSESTQGNGSTMTFKVIDNTFTTTDIQRLMSHIRIVFTDESGTILAGAKLDTSANAVVLSGDSVTAPIKLCQIGTESIDSDGETGSNTITTMTFGDFKEFDNADKGQMKITALDQNTAKVVSVYVYLDGQTIQNSDVGSALSQSTTGTMNLQFSSDANLVPMDYAEFKDPNAASGNTPATLTVDNMPTTATVNTGLTLPATASDGTTAITWAVTSAGETNASITGNVLTATAAGTVTVTGTSATGATTGAKTITVNAAP